MVYTLRIAHLSDPHFTHIDFCPRQFLSKRWIGNFNALLFRASFYHTLPLIHLPEFLQAAKVETLFMTGDFTTTSRKREFEEALEFTREFTMPLYTVPGNHDCYTKEVESRYYSYFRKENEGRVVYNQIAPKWFWIGLDCAVATPPFNAYGMFSEEMERELEKALASIPENAHVIVANHFPLFGSGHPKHDLKGHERLQAVLKKWLKVKLYLHGHDHHPYTIDGKEKNLPLVFNSGSCARKKDGGFSIYDLDEMSCLHQRYCLKKVSKEVAPSLLFEKSYVLR